MEPLVRENTEAPYSGVEVTPASPAVSMTPRDEQRASALWRRLLHFRRTNPNSRLGLLSMNQLFDSFRVVLSEPARFRAMASSASADGDGNGDAASLLESPIPNAGLQSLTLTAAGELFQDSVGEVLSKSIADLLLLIPPTMGNAFEAAYLEHTVVSPLEISSRKRAIVAVSQHVADCLCMLNIQEQLKVFLFGSVGLATVLPGGDNDVTLVLGDHLSRSPSRISDPWVPESPPSGSFDSFLQARAPPSSANPALDFLEEAKHFILRKVEAQNAALTSNNRDPDTLPRQLIQIHGEVINAAVPLLKLDYQDQHIDISLDQMGGRTSMIFVHRVDEKIGQDNLFRRSLLLVKHYCSSVLHVLGAQAGGLGSYTVTVMLLAVFNGLPAKVLEEGILEQMGDGTSRRAPLTPLKILIMFLDYYAHFDFDSYVVTIFGPLPVAAVQLTNHENTEAARCAYQQWVAITEIDSDTTASTSAGRTSDFASPNSNFNPQGEMHKANGFNVFGRSFREQASSPSGTLLSSYSAGAQSGPASGRSSEAGGAVSPIESTNTGLAGGVKAISLDPPLQGGDCCPGSILSALESAPGVAQPCGSNHYTEHRIREDFVEEYVHALSSEDRDLAFSQKIFFFPRTRKPIHHHQHTLSGEVPPTTSSGGVTSSTPSSTAPKPIAASLFKVRMMNIRDPLRPFSNLTPGVQRSSLCRIQSGFAKGVEALRASIHSMCFTDVDGTKYNPERVLEVVCRELNLRKMNPTEDTPLFHGIPVNVGTVSDLFRKQIAPNRKEPPLAEGEAAPPSPSDEKRVNSRHVEDMLVNLASHSFTLLPPPVTDTQQFWASLIPYVRQVHSSSLETVSPPLASEDPKKIFGIFKMSYEDIKKPISEFKAPSAQDSAMMAKQYPHHHQSMGGHSQHSSSAHHHLPAHHHVPPHAHHQQQQHQHQQHHSNGAVGRRQSNQASYGRASPAPESHASVPGAAPVESVVSRPNSQHSSVYHISPSYGKSGVQKQPGNSEAPPLPPRVQQSGSAAPSGYNGTSSAPALATPAPRSHNPYMPSAPASGVPPQATAAAEANLQPSPSPAAVTSGSPQQSPPAGRGRGAGRGGARGRGIQ